MEDEYQKVREAAADALSAFGPDAKEAVPALTEALKHKDAGTRWSAVRALGKIGPDAREAIPALTKALKDEDEDVRKEAKAALEKIRSAADTER